MPQHFHPSQYQPHSPHPIRCHRYNSDESLPCTLPAKRPTNTTTHQTHCDVKEYNNSGIVFDKNIKHMTLHSTLYRSSTLLYSTLPELLYTTLHHPTPPIYYNSEVSHSLTGLDYCFSRLTHTLTHSPGHSGA